MCLSHSRCLSLSLYPSHRSLAVPLSSLCRSHRSAALTAVPLSPLCLSHRCAALTAVPLSPQCRSHRCVPQQVKVPFELRVAAAELAHTAADQLNTLMGSGQFVQSVRASGGLLTGASSPAGPLALNLAAWCVVFTALLVCRVLSAVTLWTALACCPKYISEAVSFAGVTAASGSAVQATMRPTAAPTVDDTPSQTVVLVGVIVVSRQRGCHSKIEAANQ